MFPFFHVTSTLRTFSALTASGRFAFLYMCIFYSKILLTPPLNESVFLPISFLSILLNHVLALRCEIAKNESISFNEITDYHHICEHDLLCHIVTSVYSHTVIINGQRETIHVDADSPRCLPKVTLMVLNIVVCILMLSMYLYHEMKDCFKVYHESVGLQRPAQP